MSDAERLKNFLSEATHMVVSVVLPDGTPWAVPVKILAQAGTMLEWDSHEDTVHSQALASNGNVAITIYKKDTGTEFGFCAKATAGVAEHRPNGIARYRATHY